MIQTNCSCPCDELAVVRQHLHREIHGPARGQHGRIQQQCYQWASGILDAEV